MTRYLLAATALATGLTAFAAPATARDRSAYFGIEIGVLNVVDTDLDNDLEEAVFDGLEIDHKLGVDGDLIAGYDFGMFRAEAELGYKRSHHNEYSFINDEETIDFDAEGRSSVYSLMANAMVDLGRDEGFNFYAGAGVGYAQVIHSFATDEELVEGKLKIKDRGLAWQVIAGVRTSVSQYFDLGLKYRYFNAGNVDDRIGEINFDTEYKSHSLLLSLIHNFNSPAAPPPPPPPVMAPPPPPAPPATQTCADGSVILATDACPLPPAPPPPPPPEPERG
jgi:opacity protein-like surface antigen